MRQFLSGFKWVFHLKTLAHCSHLFREGFLSSQGLMGFPECLHTVLWSPTTLTLSLSASPVGASICGPKVDILTMM